MNLWDRIRFAREGSAVERCHVHPHARSYTVGHHSLDLVTLLILTWQAAHSGDLPRAQLITAAAFHDVPERVTGDVPQPIKVLLGNVLDAAEERLLVALGVYVELDEYEAKWLKICDRVELYLWSIEEAHQRGYKYFLEWVTDYDNYFEINPPPFPFDKIMNQARAYRGERMSFNKLKEIAGL